MADLNELEPCGGCGGDHSDRYSCIECGAKMCADCVAFRHPEHAAEWCEDCTESARDGSASVPQGEK